MNTRKIGGKIYRLWTRTEYKTMAEGIAHKIRERDSVSARVIKVSDGYAVYYRK